MVSVRRKVAGLVPQPVRFQLRKILYSGNAETCPMCRNSVRTYISHGGGFEVLERRQLSAGCSGNMMSAPSAAVRIACA